MRVSGNVFNLNLHLLTHFYLEGERVWFITDLRRKCDVFGWNA